MSEHGSESPRGWAAAVVRGFADATNLLIAGRRFRIRGDGPNAVALAELLAAIGARRVVAGEAADYLFCTGEQVTRLSADELGLSPRALLVVDATVDSAIDDESFGPLLQLRDGVWATGAADVFVVRLRGRSATRPSRQPDVESAAARVSWARRFMPTTEGIAADFAATGTVRGLRIGLSMVLEPKTAVLALALRDAGADVTVFAHPDETDDAVAAALRDAGLTVYANAAAQPAEHRDLALAFLAERPRILIDDGSHLIRLAHESEPAPGILDGLIGAAEETTSGLRPLRRMAELGILRIPVIAVNDAGSKTLFDNRYGTGQSCLFAILALTDLDLGGRTVVVAGYGHVGEGVAHHARAFGATVVVAELDAVRALQAIFDGYQVAPLVEAVRDADLVISATGVTDTIGLAVLRACARDTVVAVAGGVDQEIAIDAAVHAGAVRETIAHKVERFTFPAGSSILILDDGGCINITAAEGNPIEIMDLSFAVQLSAIRYLVESGDSLPPGVHPLPARADVAVAAAALRSAGVAVDARAAAPSAADGWRSARFDQESPQ